MKNKMILLTDEGENSYKKQKSMLYMQKMI